jgi:hypothetical protein
VTRGQLEHVIRAAAAITGDDEIVVIGSTSILGQFPDAPVEMLGSIEADIYPRNHPERFELLDIIGEMSRFQETFGYYADPVQHDLPKLPSGWEGRLISVSVDGSGRVRGLCLEVHDLVLPSTWRRDRRIASSTAQPFATASCSGRCSSVAWTRCLSVAPADSAGAD